MRCYCDKALSGFCGCVQIHGYHPPPGAEVVFYTDPRGDRRDVDAGSASRLPPVPLLVHRPAARAHRLLHRLAGVHHSGLQEDVSNAQHGVKFPCCIESVLIDLYKDGDLMRAPGIRAKTYWSGYDWQLRPTHDWSSLCVNRWDPRLPRLHATQVREGNAAIRDVFGLPFCTVGEKVETCRPTFTQRLRFLAYL